MNSMTSGRPATPKRALTVLLVEDDASVAAITTRWLRAMGHEVVVCADGREACDLACSRTGPIDLLVTDVMLPGLRGPILAEAIRARHPEMAVLFSSGYSPELLSEMFASNTEAALLLYKPYTEAELAYRVNLALSRKAASKAAAEGPAGSAVEGEGSAAASLPAGTASHR
jgi:DNA-binding response OmpR family regulator